MYHIIGDFEFAGETELESFAFKSDAIRWAERYCRRDLGGYDSVSVVAVDGENRDVIFCADATGWQY